MIGWLEQVKDHPLVGALICLLLLLAVTALRALTHRSRLRRELDGSFTLTAVGLVAGTLAVVANVTALHGVTPYLNAVMFGAVAIGVVRAALTLFVDFYLRQREGAALSALVRDVASIVAYFLVILLVLRSTLDINLASLIATSAVLTVIVGLALQDLLSNLFSGLVIEMEAPFDQGDWVRIGTFEGQVQETGWRTTKLRTRVNEIITLPNVMLAKEPIVNYSRPDPLYGDTLRFELAYDAPPTRVRDAVTAVLAADARVAATPAAEVRLEKFADSGVGYAVRYWLTDYGDIERIRSTLMSNLWYAFRRAEIRIPYPVRELFVYPGHAGAATADAAELVPTLRRIPLLAPLSDAALRQLAQRARRMGFGIGELVVREGDAGDSFYVIERGVADVVLENGGHQPQRLDRLQAGGFFGEMSLLAGEPRTATVRAASDLDVLVVDREAFKEIISADPALLGPLSEIAARRHSAADAQRQLQSSERHAADVQHVQRLRERIRAFLRL